jgi:hypothetical protein
MPQADHLSAVNRKLQYSIQLLHPSGLPFNSAVKEKPSYIVQLLCPSGLHFKQRENLPDSGMPGAYGAVDDHPSTTSTVIERQGTCLAIHEMLLLPSCSADSQ